MIQLRMLIGYELDVFYLKTLVGRLAVQGSQDGNKNKA
jgi:hypothetical protein